MTLSTGIGGGIVLADGSVYRGADSWAGEIGHITLDPDGPECLCGARGCFERLCCGLWLERDYGKPASELFQDPAFVARYVVDLAQGHQSRRHAAEPGAHRHRRRHRPSRRAAVRAAARELRRQVTNWSQARLDVVPAELGNDSVLWGALALAREG